ncbi:hypothetical protein C8J41_1095 [Sphingomonas sp. PP-CC-3G-468]|nr:hypothetical protein C8J41_1095 [Sphingomonas sp. PP-CC-3G-468]
MDTRATGVLGGHEAGICHPLLGIIKAGEVADLGQQRGSADQFDAAQGLKSAHQWGEMPRRYRLAERGLETDDAGLRFQHPFLKLLKRELLMRIIKALFR